MADLQQVALQVTKIIATFAARKTQNENKMKIIDKDRYRRECLEAQRRVRVIEEEGRALTAEEERRKQAIEEEMGRLKASWSQRPPRFREVAYYVFWACQIYSDVYTRASEILIDCPSSTNWDFCDKLLGDGDGLKDEGWLANRDVLRKMVEKYESKSDPFKYLAKDRNPERKKELDKEIRDVCENGSMKSIADKLEEMSGVKEIQGKKRGDIILTDSNGEPIVEPKDLREELERMGMPNKDAKGYGRKNFDKYMKGLPLLRYPNKAHKKD